MLRSIFCKSHKKMKIQKRNIMIDYEQIKRKTVEAVKREEKRKTWKGYPWFPINDVGEPIMTPRITPITIISYEDKSKDPFMVIDNRGKTILREPITLHESWNYMEISSAQKNMFSRLSYEENLICREIKRTHISGYRETDEESRVMVERELKFDARLKKEYEKIRNKY